MSMHFPPGVKHHFSSTSFGEIHSVEAGSGTPLVLLHSVGCSAHEFAPVFGPLSEHYHVAAWDMPGHGDSTPLTRRLTIEDYADAALEWMEARGFANAHVLGASIGGHIALAAAEQSRRPLQTLSLVETGLLPPDEWERRWAFAESSFAIAQQAQEEVAQRFRVLDDDLLRRWNIDRCKAGGSSMMSAMWAIRRFDFQRRLKGELPPVLLLYGAKSPLLESLALAREHLPKAPTVTLDDCGHFPMIDDPRAFIAGVEGFLKHPGMLQ